MKRKRKAHASAGWVLVEVLCSVMIVSALAAHIIESSGMMARASASGLANRTRTMDFSSIAGEAECAHSSESVFRGSWHANMEMCAAEKGIGRVEVSVSLESDEARDAINWTVWDIKGRSR